MSMPEHQANGVPFQAPADDTDDLAPQELRDEDVDLDDPERERSSTAALWEGDEGALDVDQRRALVVLLKQRFISRRTHKKEWDALIRNPRPIRSRLNDLFLDLNLDTEREVAYKRQVAAEGGGRPYPTLLYDAPWGREDTVLLVYLRSRFRSEQAGGADRVFVDRDAMLEFVDQHRPGHATDQSGDVKRAAKAIETLFKAGLLLGASTGDRFEISNAIEALLPMERLQQLLTWLRQQNGAPSDYTESTDTDTEPGEAPADHGDGLRADDDED